MQIALLIFCFLTIAGAFAGWRKSPLYSVKTTLKLGGGFLLIVAVVAGTAYVIVNGSLSRSPVAEGIAGLVAAMAVACGSSIFIVRITDSHVAALPPSARLVSFNRHKVYQWIWRLVVFLLICSAASLVLPTAWTWLPVGLGGFSFQSAMASYYLVWTMTGGAFLLAANLLGSRQGRAIRSLRGGTAMAESLGIDTFRVRLAAFVVCALCAALSGWLFAHVQRVISPTAFDIGPGIEYLFMAMLGGAGHIGGAVLGAALVTLARDALQDYLPLFGPGAGQAEVVVFSVLFILVLQTARGGIIPAVARRLPRRPYRSSPCSRR